MAWLMVKCKQIVTVELILAITILLWVYVIFIVVKSISNNKLKQGNAILLSKEEGLKHEKIHHKPILLHT